MSLLTCTSLSIHRNSGKKVRALALPFTSLVTLV